MKHIIDAFTETAQQYPDRIAIQDCESQLTYRELDECSNIIAHQLQSPCVLIMLPRRASFLISTFATLKAGSTYVGVNTDYPADRIRYIAEDSGAGVIITTTSIWNEKKTELECLIGSGLSLILIDQTDWAAGDAAPVNKTTWEQEAFMLYTSGTTGKPKGVVHHIHDLTSIMQPYVVVDKQRSAPVREAVFGDICFAASLTDLYAPGFTGGTIFMMDEATRMDMERMAAFINEHQIDRMFMGSSIGMAMLKQYDLHLGQLILGGEKVTGATPDIAARVDVIQQYGASEGYPIAEHHITGHEEVIPVGTQYGDDKVYILDPSMRPVPQGQMGEIYFSSDRIAKGYRNLPELTAQRFLDDPFRQGKRMLRTCDLGYIDEHGELVHCGRADNMFKIHGQRVEPGEVENVAQQFEGVGDCICCKKEVNGDETVCLFFEADETIDTDELHSFMSKQLTHYMVPAIIMQLDSLPRNARGKLDRKALPNPQVENSLMMIPPATDREKLLFDIVARHLDTNQFGVTDNLLHLGLNSIRAMKIVAEACRKGLMLKATDLMKNPAIRQVLQVNMQMAYWWNVYDESKPIMVFAHGIALTSNMKGRLDLLSRHFSVFTIENIEEHFHYIFEDENYDEVINFYTALLQVFLPENARVTVFAGVSFGGILSYSLAERWSRETGQKPAVVMTDSLLVSNPGLTAAVLTGTLDEFCQRNHIPRQTFNESFVRRLYIVSKIESKGRVLPCYDGPVVLMNATVLPPGIPQGANVALWRELASGLEVTDYDCAHDYLCVDASMAGAFCQHVILAMGEYLWQLKSTKEGYDVYMKVFYEKRVHAIEQYIEENVSFKDYNIQADWTRNEELSDLQSAFWFTNEKSPDVVGLYPDIFPSPDRSKQWFMGHYTGEYPLTVDVPVENNSKLTFENNGFSVLTEPTINHWVYVASKKDMPEKYAVEFDYEGRTPIQEQIQFDIFATSLANRFRVISAFGEKLFFDVVRDSYFLKRFYEKDCQMPIGETNHIRLEVDRNHIVFYLNYKKELCVTINEALVTPGRFIMLFWNFFEEKSIDVSISNFVIYTPG